MHNIPEITSKDVEVCRKIQSHFATSYYIATLTFPKEIRLATFVLYAFFRLPDEIVDSDTGNNAHRTTSHLREFMDEWKRIYDSHPSLLGGTDERSCVLRATSFIFHKYNVPYVLSESFLGAMEMDLTVTHYKTSADLYKYMYGSAAVVGLIMIHITGYTSDTALPRAIDLGNAMQLTNFLRDVKSDFIDRGRIYLPEESLKRHGLSYDDIAYFSKTMSIDDRWVDYIKEEISTIRSLYKRAQDEGIPLLSKSSRIPILISLRLYRGILDSIEDMGYNIFAQRASVPKWKKIWIVFSSYIL